MRVLSGLKGTRTAAFHHSDLTDATFIMEENNNTLGKWSDGDDDWIWEIEENMIGQRSDDEEQTGRGRKRKSDEINEGSTSSTNNEDTSTDLPENNFYVVENVKQTKSKKFRMSAMDYSIRNREVRVQSIRNLITHSFRFI